MEANPTLTDEQKKELLDRQFQTAMAGSEALQIHLGKSYLGQHERTHHIVEAVPYEGLTHEEWLDRLVDRQRELLTKSYRMNWLQGLPRKGIPAALLAPEAKPLKRRKAAP